MKLDLINKKTGEIGYLIVGKGSNHYVVTNNLWESCGEYNSLAELNEEWEDYEEPEDYWYIDPDGNVEKCRKYDEWDKPAKEIGNYFETKKEAEKAVEKLKAWKRLKDKGFRIALHGCKGNAWLEANWGNLQGDYSDILFLFGGEE